MSLPGPSSESLSTHAAAVRPVGLGLREAAAAVTTAFLILELWNRVPPPPAAVALRDHEALAARLVAHAPLDPDPYFLAALAAEAKGDVERAEALADAAIRRNPRRTDPRLWRMARYLATGRADAGLAEAVTLYRIRPELSSQLSTLLAEAARDPALREMIARRLANSPLIVDVVRHGAAAGLAPATLIGLVGRTDLARLPGGVRETQAAVTRPLIAHGAYAEAKAAWDALLPGAAPRLLFDGAFRLPEAAPPFAWSLRSDGDVEAVALTGGGLRVRAFGDLPIAAAEQMLVLRPGPYHFAYVARGSTNGLHTSAWRWRILCPGNAVPLEAAVMDGVVRLRFTVPAGCPHQRLELRSSGSVADTAEGLLLERVALARAS